MHSKDIYGFIKPHLGEINPSGYHEIDVKNLENFETYRSLLELLTGDLFYVYMMGKNRPEKSISDMGKEAEKVLLDIKCWFDDLEIGEG